MAISNDHPTAEDTVASTSGSPQARRGNACLIVVRGEQLGARLSLDNAEIRIGRSSDCALQFPERSVSRNHCRITRHGEIFWLDDLGSKNRTFLNERPIERVPLRDGDQIRIGSTVLKFIGAGNIEADYHSTLHHHVVRDSLTGLFNRTYALDLLDTLVRTMHRSRSSEPVCLAIIDIDHFKRVNDQYGHLAGDSALCQITALMLDQLGADAELARLGGEEFALIMTDTTLESALEITAQLRREIAQHRFDIDSQPIRLTISIGVAALDPAMTQTRDLLGAADQQLYKAKQAGRNRVC